jgi:hypothetical protein
MEIVVAVGVPPSHKDDLNSVQTNAEMQQNPMMVEYHFATAAQC